MPALPPISNIEEDVLWRIFDIIANLRREHDDDQDTEGEQSKQHPLTMIRNISQVCFAWRRLAVESSSLWGSMIDMSVIGRVSESWRSLIMSRTKEATLFVYGNVDGKHEVTRCFFTGLLSSDWHRIAELTVVISSVDLFDNALWTIFWERPAVHLTNFAVTFQNSSPSELATVVPRDGIPFRNYAPSLKAFHTIEFNISAQATWIPGLRELTLCSHLSAIQVLDLLSRIPRLEVLYILGKGNHLGNIHNFPSSTTGSLRRITLPSLRRLHISSSFQACSTLLSYIHNPHDTFSYLRAICTNRSIDDEIMLEDIKSFIPVLTTYAQRFLVSVRLTGIGIVMALGYFGITFDHLRSFNGSQRSRQSAIHILNNRRFPSTSHSLLIKALSTCNLSAVKTLTLTTTSGKGIDSTDPNFLSFILALTGVETLIIPEASVQLLNDIECDVSIIFPSLHTLRLDVLSRRVSLRLDESIELFLSRRVAVGIPVAVLDISKFVSGFEEKMNWVFLDSIKGLTVVWTVDEVTMEYICGTGDPDMLNFSNTHNNMPSK